MKNKEARAKALRSLKRKLMVAVSMLLVSVIMMTSVTYAWLVLSTAPEVSGVTTQVGANGSLEIALLNTESYNNLALLDENDFDESVSTSVASNLRWGNLVNLNDTSYGLSSIILQPARLNIKQNGSDENGNILYNLNNSLLKVPVMGENGQIVGIKGDAAVSSVFTDGKFPAGNEQTYGVRAIGTSSNQSIYQQALNTARNTLGSATSEARTTASNTLNETGGALGNIVVKYALGSSSDYSETDIQAMKNLAVGLDKSLQQIELGLRQVYAAYIASDQYTQPEGWDYEAALADITGDSAKSLSELLTAYGNAGVEQMAAYITKYNTNKTKVTNAINQCDTMLANGGPYAWDQIVATMNPLVDYSQMTLNGKTIADVKAMSNDEILSFVASSGGMVITVPSGSGIISDVADFAGNYVANVKVKNVSYGGHTIDEVTVKMTTATEEDPVYLLACSRIVNAMKAAEAVATNNITDFYGYAIDLAFRTNASDSNLLLQTDSANRIGDAYVDNTNLQGGGSYMQFGTENGISITKMVKLMNAVRVVFVDTDKNVLCIAALDAYLGTDAYEVIKDEAEKEAHPGMYAVLNTGVTGLTAQNSDYITETEYNSLSLASKATTVEFDKNAKTVKARLYLYAFHMTVSDVADKDGNYGLTGGITLDGKLESSAITSLVENQVKVITAITYFDGSVVNNTMVSAESPYSLKGVLNLQFASDVNLVPAYNESLANGGGTGGETGGGTGGETE